MPVDVTKPSVGRIYDYVLGGHHNFEVDRVAAQQILKVVPSYPRWARLNRWFLQMVAARWAAEGYDQVLDLGSGLPTQGHFHDAMPNAKILYTDSDPMTVAYARDVLGDNPAVTYIQADIREPGAILKVASQALDRERRIAIGCIGVSYFVDDVSLAQLAQALHAWAAPGSVMALSFFSADPTSPNLQEILETYRRNAADVYLRDEAAMRQLLAPWQMREYRPLASWLEMESMMQESDREGSANVEMYGALLVRG
jgi:O-methyltransferase involved in polyketide biosynthesis